jgi:hypothetical protein
MLVLSMCTQLYRGDEIRDQRTKNEMDDKTHPSLTGGAWKFHASSSVGAQGSRLLASGF